MHNVHSVRSVLLLVLIIIYLLFSVIIHSVRCWQHKIDNYMPRNDENIRNSIMHFLDVENIELIWPEIMKTSKTA